MKTLLKIIILPLERKFYEYMSSIFYSIYLVMKIRNLKCYNIILLDKYLHIYIINYQCEK